MSMCSSSVAAFASSLNLSQALEIARLRHQLADVSRENKKMKEEIVKLNFINTVLETKKDFYVGCCQTAHRFLADERKTVEELREKCVCGKRDAGEIKKVKEEVFEDEEAEIPGVQNYVAEKTVKKEVLDESPIEPTRRPATGLKRRMNNVSEENFRSSKKLKVDVYGSP
ncbi:unnamed protein product [Caenorhabditis nigoni]